MQAARLYTLQKLMVLQQSLCTHSCGKAGEGKPDAHAHPFYWQVEWVQLGCEHIGGDHCHGSSIALKSA